MVWPAIIAAGAAVVGGVLGNKASAGEASKARDFSAEQYATRYQTTMADMRQAGLNPMLAYSQGPGTAPTGAMAAQGDFGGGNAASAISQMNIRKAQTKQADTASNQNIATAKNLDEDTKLKAIQNRKTSAEIDKIKGETATEFQRSILVGAQGQLTGAQTREVESKINQLAAQTGLQKSQLVQLKQEIAKFMKSGSGWIGTNFDDFLKTLKTIGKIDARATAATLSSAKSLWQLLKDNQRTQ